MSSRDRVVPLAAFVSRVVGGGTPSRSVPSNWAGLIPWASVKDLRQGDLALDDTEEHISARALRESASNLVPAGIPIVCTRMAVGRVAVPTVDVAINQDLKALFPSDDVDSRYLLHGIQFLQPKLEAVATGSTVKGLQVRELLAFQLHKPAIAEQRRVAESLDALDDQIRIGKELVSKLNLLSAGLADRLLRDGGDRAEPPTGWQFRTVGEIYEVQAGITLGPHRAPQRNSTGYLRVANVQRSVIDLRDIARLQASPVERAKYRLAAGDLLVVEGHADINQIGRCARVPEGAEGLVYQNHLFRLRSTELNQVVGEAWLNSRYARQYWRRSCSSSSGLNTINSKQLRAMRVLVPPPEEQGRIAATLMGMTARIEREKEVLDKLLLQKAGLIADLLTGRVRVPAEATS